MREPEVLAAMLLRHVRVPLRVALHVQLVDDRVAPGHARGARLAPVERGVHDAALRHVRCAVLAVGDPVITRLGSVQCRMPDEVTGQRRRTRVHEELGGIESMSVGWLVRAVDPVAIKRARPAEAGGQESVPAVPGAGRKFQARSLDPAGGIEQAEFDARGVCREDHEVRAATRPGRAERLRRAGLEKRRRLDGRIRCPVVHRPGLNDRGGRTRRRAAAARAAVGTGNRASGGRRS